MYDVRHVLRKAGLRSTYSGYNYLASAVALVLKDQEFYLKNVTSNLYRVVGEQYGVSNMCVEAAIRTMINSYWNQNSNKILMVESNFQRSQILPSEKAYAYKMRLAHKQKCSFLWKKFLRLLQQSE